MGLFNNMKKESDFQSNAVLYNKTKREVLNDLLNAPLRYCGFEFMLCEYVYKLADKEMCAYMRVAHKSCVKEEREKE